MAKPSSDAPQPSPKIGQAADQVTDLGNKWLQFSKDQFALSQQRQGELDALVKQVTDRQNATAGQAADWASQDRARYDTTFKPLEDKFLDTVANYASPEKQAEAAAEAKADVTTAATQAREQAQRQAFGLGIRPDSGRFAGIDRAGELGTALAVANAQNGARQNLRDKALDLTASAVNLGQQTKSNALTEANLGLGAGSSAASIASNNKSLADSATGIVDQGMNGAIGGITAGANINSNLYGLGLNAYKTAADENNANWSGILGAIGTGAGLILSSKKAKKAKTPIKSGVARKAVDAMPVEQWDYKPGMGDGGRHVGPYAEDFKAATGKGDGKTIPVQDAIGVTMRAVQDLSREVTKIEDRLGMGKPASLKLAPKRRAAAPAPQRAAA